VMDVETLHDLLRKSQERLGYYFNRDTKITRETLAGLLVNKERYGYMACPCRLADGEFEFDRDIVCPCEYRQADVAEFGSCYCNLYVSKSFNDHGGGRIVIPERRPEEKMGF